MYGIYANIWGILMVNVTIYSIHGSYGIRNVPILLVQIHFGICLSCSLPRWALFGAGLGCLEGAAEAVSCRDSQHVRIWW